MDDAGALGHLLDDGGALGHQVVVMLGGEELVDEEGPGHEDEEEGVAELGVAIHAVREAVEADVLSLGPVGEAVLLLCAYSIVVSLARLHKALVLLLLRHHHNSGVVCTIVTKCLNKIQ